MPVAMWIEDNQGRMVVAVQEPRYMLEAQMSGLEAEEEKTR